MRDEILVKSNERAQQRGAREMAKATGVNYTTALRHIRESRAAGMNGFTVPEGDEGSVTLTYTQHEANGAHIHAMLRDRARINGKTYILVVEAGHTDVTYSWSPNDGRPRSFANISG